MTTPRIVVTGKIPGPVLVLKIIGEVAWTDDEPIPHDT